MVINGNEEQKVIELLSIVIYNNFTGDACERESIEEVNITYCR
jgi:hypothetical protein